MIARSKQAVRAEIRTYLTLSRSESPESGPCSRFLPCSFTPLGLPTQLNTLLREASGKPFISLISVDEASLKRNFESQGDAIPAEPIYIALQMAGYEGEAHELVNHIAMPHLTQMSF